MKKVNIFVIMYLFLICAACASRPTTESKQSNLGMGSKIPIIAMFDDYNEIFKGYYTEHGIGNTNIEMKGQVTGMRCQGYSYPTQIPTDSVNCEGLEGKAHLTCDDGRKIDMIWKAIACFKGVAKGIDQNGNKLTFVYGMTELEATKYIEKLSKVMAYKPSLPPVYKPKETRKEKGFATATGFFVTDNGYMITNYHVIEGANEIFVALIDGSLLRAKFIKADPKNDIALIKINAATKPLIISEKGGLSKGEEVFTLGYPLIAIQGQEQKATFGRINSLSGIQGDIRVCQIDIPIQPGNSGGPLINKNGVVVGVITATLDSFVALKLSGQLPQNVNYAVKSDYIIPVIRDSIKEELDGSKSGKKELSALIKVLEPSVALVVSK